MLYAGIMSGTSLDGIDVAIVDIEKQRGGVKVETVGFHGVPYDPNVRAAILAVSDTMTHTSAISRLNFLLGELYAEALMATCRRAKISLESLAAVGLHGQTIYHEGMPANFLGRKVANTYQIGEAAVIAERTGVDVISNFRERDVAAGGRGAPLVPLADYLLFRSPRDTRVALNIGGIANITILPAGCDETQVRAFDTGPGNMVIDALVSHMTGGARTYDKGGAIARKGRIEPRMLAAMLDDPYLKLAPPKTCGREQFGQAFANGLIATGLPIEDLIVTATEFTAQSIINAVAPVGEVAELIVAGGGVHNRTLMKRIAAGLPETDVITSAAYGVDPDAKEAVAFALLAYRTVNGEAGNLPSATGARRAVVLGKTTRASAATRPLRSMRAKPRLSA